MKTTLVVFIMLCAASAFGQAVGTISSQPTPAVFSEHPLHAEPHSMATQTPIAGGSADGYGYEKGEQPLWQFGPVAEPVALGDVARAYRKEKLTGKRAETILEKQGS
ncbi:MAG TPA: hypothetical protein VJ453_10060 [Terriglobales bacterium]|nr:hypothetical protein [Terriglobales bacterium]HVI80088.1 hypothetical protein [Candidatus Acidoferrum sp.]